MLVEFAASAGEIEVIRQSDSRAIQVPRRCAEGTVTMYLTAKLRVQSFGEANRIAFNHEINIGVGALEQQIADEAADQIKTDGLIARVLSNPLDKIGDGLTEQRRDVGGA